MPVTFIFVRPAVPSLLDRVMIVHVPRAKRHRPTFGLLVFIAIILLVVAFGLFKRKGARKPPPPPVESSVLRRQDPPESFVRLAADGDKSELS